MKEFLGPYLSRTTHRLRLFAAIAAVALSVLASPAHSEERPFEPIFEVSSAVRAAGEPTQVQIYFELKEGDAFPTKAVFEIPGAYQIPRGSDIPNGDIVGDGLITIKAGALGIQTVNVCLSNRNPARAGDWATINVAVQLGSTNPSGCTGILNLTLSLTRQEEGAPYTAVLELPAGGGGLGLDTPIKLTVNLYGVSRADPQAVPPAPGNVETLKNPSTPGIYEWRLTVQDAAGRVKVLVQPQRIDQPPPRPSQTGEKLTRWAALAGGATGAVLLIGLIVFFARRKARKIYEEVAAQRAELESYEYFNSSPFDDEQVATSFGSGPHESHHRST